MLFESSDEGKKDGLGLLKGQIKHLPKNSGELIPHIGWALLSQHKECPLFIDNLDKKWMYFVHSYAAIPSDEKDLAATARYGKTNVAAIVWKERLGACQFHPEKSGKAGQDLLIRWVKWLEESTKN